MTNTILTRPVALSATLDDIIDSHGLFFVLRAVVARPFRRTRVPPLGLNDHLRRDIGLGLMQPWIDPLL